MLIGFFSFFSVAPIVKVSPSASVSGSVISSFETISSKISDPIEPEVSSLESAELESIDSAGFEIAEFSGLEDAVGFEAAELVGFEEAVGLEATELASLEDVVGFEATELAGLEDSAGLEGAIETVGCEEGVVLAGFWTCGAEEVVSSLWVGLNNPGFELVFAS